MDFSLSEEQELILGSIREMISREFTEEYFKKCDLNYTYPVEFMQALADNGITMLGVSEELGGTPADVMTQMLAIEEVGRMGAPAFLMSGAHNIHNMLSFGNEEQLKKTVEVVGETGIPAFSLAITEPQAGSDNNMLSTSYTRRNGKIYLNGQKNFITGAADYPYMLVVARDPEGTDPRRCFSMWWVDPKAKGVRLSPLHKVGWRMVSNCEVFFDDVELDESALVGQEGNGFLHLMKNFEIERLTIAAYSLGPAECAFEDAARYANQRMQFGQNIGKFQLVQEKLTNMAIKIQNMKNYVYRVAWEEDNGQSLRLSAAMCKLYCSCAAQEVIDDAMQVMGGVGYTDDCRIGRLWRDIRVSRIGGGTDEIMTHVAGRQILKQYA